MITSFVDSRAQSWLTRFNRLSNVLHTQLIQDISDFKASCPMTLRMARTGFLISPYELEPYGLSASEYSALNKAARDFKSNETGQDEVLNSRFENLRSLYHRATESSSRINYLTFVKPDNRIDLIFFRCETDRNEQGVPLVKLNDKDFGERITFELSEIPQDIGHFKQITKFKAGENPVEAHTIQLEMGKKYTAYFFDGYAMRGRNLSSSPTLNGKPKIGSLMALRS